MAELIRSTQARRSIAHLAGSSFAQLARKVVERSAGDRRALHHAGPQGVRRTAARGGRRRAGHGGHGLSEVPDLAACTSTSSWRACWLR